jgi:hypothetical protein
VSEKAAAARARPARRVCSRRCRWRCACFGTRARPTMPRLRRRRGCGAWCQRAAGAHPMSGRRGSGLVGPRGNGPGGRRVRRPRGERAGRREPCATLRRRALVAQPTPRTGCASASTQGRYRRRAPGDAAAVDRGGGRGLPAATAVEIAWGARSLRVESSAWR